MFLRLTLAKNSGRPGEKIYILPQSLVSFIDHNGEDYPYATVALSNGKEYFVEEKFEDVFMTTDEMLSSMLPKPDTKGMN